MLHIENNEVVKHFIWYVLYLLIADLFRFSDSPCIGKKIKTNLNWVFKKVRDKLTMDSKILPRHYFVFPQEISLDKFLKNVESLFYYLWNLIKNCYWNSYMCEMTFFPIFTPNSTFFLSSVKNFKLFSIKCNSSQNGGS